MKNNKQLTIKSPEIVIALWAIAFSINCVAGLTIFAGYLMYELFTKIKK